MLKNAHLKYQLTTFLSIFLLMTPHLHAAEEITKEEKLLQKFVEAVNSKDQARIDIAFAELSADADALAYMRAKEPHVTSLYRMQETAYRLQDLQEKYGTGLGTISGDIGETRRPTPQSKRTQGNFADNRDLPPNKARPRATRLSNQEQVQRSPNQSRPSNQERIRSRVRRQ